GRVSIGTCGGWGGRDERRGQSDPEFPHDREPAARCRHTRGESSVRTARRSGSGPSEQLRSGAVLRVQLPDSSLTSPRSAGFLLIKLSTGGKVTVLCSFVSVGVDWLKRARRVVGHARQRFLQRLHLWRTKLFRGVPRL